MTNKIDEILKSIYRDEIDDIVPDDCLNQTKQQLLEAILECLPTPKQLHDWYLEAIKELHKGSYNSEANIPYELVTEEQKSIDRYISEECKRKVGELFE